MSSPSVSASKILARGMKASNESRESSSNASAILTPTAVAGVMDLSNVSAAISDQLRLQSECDNLRQELRTVYKRELTERDRAQEESRKSVSNKLQSDSLMSQLSDLTSLHESRNSALQNSENRCRNLTSQISELRGAHGVMEGEMENLVRKVGLLAEQAEDKAKFQERVEELEGELRHSRQDLAVNRTHKDAHEGLLERRLANLTDEHEQLQGKYNHLKQEVVSEAQTLSELFEAVMSDRARERLLAGAGRRDAAAAVSSEHQDEALSMKSSSDCAEHLDALAQMGATAEATAFAGPTFSALRHAVSRAATWIAESRRTKKKQDELFFAQQERDSELATDLREALAAKGELVTEKTTLEIRLAKVTEQNHTAQREREEAVLKNRTQLAHLSGLVGCVSDWTALETQLVITTSERTKLQDRHVELCRELKETQEEIVHKEKMHKIEIENAVEEYREAAEKAVLKLRTSREYNNGNKPADLNSSPSVQDSSGRHNHHANDSTSLSIFVEHEATVKKDQSFVQLDLKYKEALDHVHRLEAKVVELKVALKQQEEHLSEQKEEIDVLNRLNATRAPVRAAPGPAEASLVEVSVATSAQNDTVNHSSVTATNGAISPAGQNERQIIFNLTQVVKGLMQDHKELCSQRKALWNFARYADSVLREATGQVRAWKKGGGLAGDSIKASTSSQSTAPLLVRFRRAAIAVLAAKRIEALGRPAIIRRRLEQGVSIPEEWLAKDQTSAAVATATSSAAGRRGTAAFRVWLPHLENPNVQSASQLVLPTEYEMDDPVSMIAGLTNQLLAPARSNMTSGGSFYVPTLCNVLADGLQRLLSQGVDIGSMAGIGKDVQHCLSEINTKLQTNAKNHQGNNHHVAEVGSRATSQALGGSGSKTNSPSPGFLPGGIPTTTASVPPQHSVRSHSPLSSTTSPPQSDVQPPPGSRNHPLPLHTTSGPENVTATAGSVPLVFYTHPQASSAPLHNGAVTRPGVPPSLVQRSPSADNIQPPPSNYSSLPPKAPSQPSTSHTRSVSPSVTFQLQQELKTAAAAAEAGRRSASLASAYHVDQSVSASINDQLHEMVEEEFSTEVLSVIKALDTRVSSALRHGFERLSPPRSH